MGVDTRVQLLLDELLDSQSTPEAVCITCPELLPKVREHWRQMCLVRADLDALFPPAPEEDEGKPKPIYDSNSLPQIPGYQMETILGRGGMGIVFRAKQIRLNRVVALKMALGGAYASPSERERFQREAEAVAALRHPNIVQIHDVGDSEGLPYFTMEFVDGGSLAQKLAGTPQPASASALLIATLAEAVQAAHESGIIHRDLKPANVLLTTDSTPKITDFGVARRLDGETALTLSGVVVGTPSYMAPEQAECKPIAIGPPVDIYALGAILYELLTGRPPFKAETAGETIQQVIAQDPVPPSRLNATVPRDLETICLKCLHKEPRLRYASAAALAEDLRRFLCGEAIAARPEGLLARLARRVRRRPGFYAAITSIAILTIALGVGAAWTLSEREAISRAAHAEAATAEKAVEADLMEMANWLKNSQWPQAKAAFERARDRLGERGNPDLCRLLENGKSNLKLAAQLEEIRLQRAVEDDVQWFLNYRKAFRDAGFCTIGDDPEAVARRIDESNIRKALLTAFDDWSLAAHSLLDPQNEIWLLDVTRRVDRDPSGWRDRYRDPEVRRDKKALLALAKSAKVEGTSVNLLVGLGELLRRTDCDSISFLKKVQLQYPQDFWVNFNLLLVADNAKDSLRFGQVALAIRPETPMVYYNLGYGALWDRSLDEALYYFLQAVRLDPENPKYHSGVASCLFDLNREAEALEEIQRGISLNPDRLTLGYLKFTSKNIKLRHAEWEAARLEWQTALKAKLPEHSNWYGYAELCLFLGHEAEYCDARRALLAKFGASKEPLTAERTARACLLLPASGEELSKSVALADFVASVDRTIYPSLHPFFQFVRGLAEYRKGNMDKAISVLRGEASKMPGPAPRLTLAMALSRNDLGGEARKMLAEAIVSYDWRPTQVRDQDSWICHVLRREAENRILPNLAAFLNGKYKPQDNDERLALIGVCQFTNRTFALARLYSDAFLADPMLAQNYRYEHRKNAACAAAQVASGCGLDAVDLGDAEREHWRKQAREWLRADLSSYAKNLSTADDKARNLLRSRLKRWRVDPELKCLRDQAELDKLSAEEKKDCLALWDEVHDLIKQLEGK